MTSSTRTGRRRRILHEGAAATPRLAVTDGDGGGSKVRYTPPADSASFAVAARALPRTPMGLASVLAALLAVTVALGWADGIVEGLAQREGVPAAAAQLLMIGQPGSLAAWWEAGLWLAVAGQCVLLFGLRRHRTDDLGGGYRWWLLVAAVAVGMSVASATHAHAAAAAQLAALTGFSPLAGDAFWWLAPGLLLLGGVAVRSVLEIKESVPSAALAGAAGAAALVAIAATVGIVPTSWSATLPLLAPGTLGPVAAIGVAALVLTALLAYSRRIVMEAFGEVESPAAKKAIEAKDEEEPKVERVRRDESSPQLETKRQAVRAPEPETEADDELAATRRREKKSKGRDEAGPAIAEETKSTQWVSGGEDYADDDYDEGGSGRRKLSKAERKRLRREKARRAA